MQFTAPLLARVLPPFEQFFRKEVVDQLPARKKIIYSQSPIEYEGEVSQSALVEREEVVREGRGVALWNGQRVCEGEWKAGLPHGKSLIQFSQLLSYDGYLEGGRLHGPGILNFNGSRIGDAKWYEGLPEEKCLRLFESE